MSLNDIFMALEREAKKQNAETLTRAKSQTEEIVAEADEAAEIILAQELEQAREQLRAQEAKIIIEAKFKSKKRLVEVKEKLIDSVFVEAQQRLSDLSKTDEYREVFTGLALEAAKAIGDNEQVVVSVSKRDLPLARSIFSKSKFDWAIEPSANDGHGGVVITSHDGRKILTNTLESRLNRASAIFRNSVGSVLFK